MQIRNSVLSLVLLLALLLSACASAAPQATAGPIPPTSPPEPTPTPAPETNTAPVQGSLPIETPLPHSMKGWELYSWPVDGEWFFTLITGTNRYKTIEEITSDEDTLTGGGSFKITVQGVEAVESVLSRLPAGESIFWFGGYGPAPAPFEGTSLALPPPEMVKAVQEHCRRLGLELRVNAQAQSQRLRVANRSAIPLQDLVVVFPDDRIEFGDVPPGTTTGYQEIPHGVYRYAAYNVEVDGRQYEQPVIDWVGESPMQGEAFTYILEADPSNWETEGQVIRLVEVIQDPEAGSPLPPVSTEASLPAPRETPAPTPSPPVETASLPSPDGRWTAVLNREAGSLEVEDAQGVAHTVFPAGSTVSAASWSPDSSRLVVALSNTTVPVRSPEETGVAEIWMVAVTGSGLSEPRLIRAAEPPDEDAGAWITFGAWSPDGRRVLFWPGPLSASIQADGLPLWSLEVETGKVTRLAETALVNPAYQSWALDGSALVFTDGGYRSAQVNKRLSLYEVEPGQVRSLVAGNALIPGAVAWSPAGDVIAFAAVRESQTGGEWADWMSWDNPAIQARRIYLLNLETGEYRRLNAAEAYQDAPRWSVDGAELYYVQNDGDQAILMAADPVSGEAQPLPGCQAQRPDRAGYYGQVDWSALYAACPALYVK